MQGQHKRNTKKACRNTSVDNNHSHCKCEPFAHYEGFNMFVCNCNGITERQVEVAVQAGAKRWKEVHAHYNCAPQCGKCQCEMIDAISEHNASNRDRGDSIFASPDLVGAT